MPCNENGQECLKTVIEQVSITAIFPSSCTTNAIATISCPLHSQLNEQHLESYRPAYMLLLLYAPTQLVR